METRILLLSLLLSAVVATRSVVEAKTTVSRIEFSSSAIKYKASERLLENDGQSAVEAFLSEHPQNDESVTNSIINDSGYDPYPDGTAVRYQDQDGTWMNGRIDTYNSDTKVYTVKWDEDNVLEDFSDLNKVDQLVANAEEQVQITNTEEQVTETNDDEVDEQFDWDDNEKLGQAPSSNGSPYRGSVPEDFDFGYTYQYDNLADYEPWPIGTVTLLEFSDGWYEGKITSFSLSEDKTNATYVVTWSDGTGDRFVNELEWMDLMVANAQHYEPWSIGT
ncbi:unnamed protein product [Pseudo-nitzschia multistriata]|uniref:Tudor domain-containing protein n=1 Tax=Pseudo-nitzschia multistriata TaxID=183589 RepID=A0A448ZKJ8_9STRA|nr:unnamed protein product [Pseudo-nitzschia multistriata]